MESLNNAMNEKTTSLVFYHNPYTKIKFVNKIINSYKIPIFYVDFDLLFSGYYKSQLITSRKYSYSCSSITIIVSVDWTLSIFRICDVMIFRSLGASSEEILSTKS